MYRYETEQILGHTVSRASSSSKKTSDKVLNDRMAHFPSILGNSNDAFDKK